MATLNTPPQPFEPLKPSSRQCWNPSVFTPEWSPEITGSWLQKDANLVGIGSCFSINLMRWLSSQGMKDISPKWGRHYNSKIILLEIERCLHKSNDFRLWQHTKKSGQLIYIDVFRHLVFADSKPELQQACEKIADDGEVALSKGDVIIITLGLSEVWEEYDLETHCVYTLNRTPPASIYSPERHRCRFQSASEVASDIQSIVKHLRSIGSPSRPIVFTVCPVPLKATFTMKDVRCANWRSKATLLSAVHDAIERISDQNVFYYDAFELFWTRDSEPSFWQIDGRHPSSSSVNLSCTRFVKHVAQKPDEFNYDELFEVPEALNAYTL
jgi:hypothetical protein